MHPAPEGLWAPQPPRRRVVDWGAVVGVTLAGLLFLVAIGVLMLILGPTTALGAGLLALLPLALVVTVLVWVDRWEPEPPGMLVLAGLWGAGVAVLIALFGNEWVGGMLAESFAGVDPDFLASTFGAPVVEELAKGAGVLVIFLARRRYFTSVVDGIVYGGFVGAGFAFSENVLYFGQAMTEGTGGVDAIGAVAVTFFARAVMSPFAHVLFTSATGVAIGWASGRRNRSAVIPATMIGLLVAMVLHALWNATAATGDSFLFLYVVLQMPIFAAFVGLTVWLRSREKRTIATRLGEYAGAGWFAPAEVAGLSSALGRRRATKWAKALGPGAATAMKSFQRTSIELAFNRDRIVHGRGDPTALASEATMLQSIGRDRDQLAYWSHRPG